MSVFGREILNQKKRLFPASSLTDLKCYGETEVRFTRQNTTKLTLWGGGDPCLCQWRGCPGRVLQQKQHQADLHVRDRQHMRCRPVDCLDAALTVTQIRLEHNIERECVFSLYYNNLHFFLPVVSKNCLRY